MIECIEGLEAQCDPGSRCDYCFDLFDVPSCLKYVDECECRLCDECGDNCYSVDQYFCCPYGTDSVYCQRCCPTMEDCENIIERSGFIFYKTSTGYWNSYHYEIWKASSDETDETDDVEKTLILETCHEDEVFKFAYKLKQLGAFI